MHAQTPPSGKAKNAAPGPAELMPNDLVAGALNEHGFMLQQIMRKKLQGHVGDPADRQDQWVFVATEYPVTAADGSQTKIDILLQHYRHKGMHMCMECKRHNPKYKKWIFFDQEVSAAGMPDWGLYIEKVTANSNSMISSGPQHDLARLSKMHIPVFNYYVEAAIKPDDRGRPSASSTEAIEKSFQQVTRGSSGLSIKLADANALGEARSIPIVVTTAELLEAKFDPSRVSIAEGMIKPKDLQLVELEYCAVNYRADDSLALRRVSAHERRVGLNDLVNRLIRSIFVVRTPSLNRFLNWAGNNLTEN